MQIFGLIGFPVSHSFSAGYFNKKFATAGIADAEYRLFPLEDISKLPDLLAQQPDFKGFNVTIPHKVAIMPYLHSISEEAESIGAVNCVKITRNGSLTELQGYNTDVHGFRESLRPLLEPWHRKALVLGTGGASKAVCFVLDESGIGYSVVSRNKKHSGYLLYSQLTAEDISENLLIINTTPSGMHPDTGNAPYLPYQYLTDRHLLFDLVYNPEETTFIKRGKAAGAKTKNGKQMFELQAEKSWEIWNK